jgi:1-acyl-sn-glycerol-3-phosphate acyltransferase
MESWLSSLWYDGTLSLTMASVTLAFSLRTEGQQHMPRSGPVLVIANHDSYLDSPVVAVAVRRRLRFLASKHLFAHRSFGWLIRSFGSVPINEEGFARSGLETLIQLLREGNAVLVFPEGERSTDGKLQSLRPGIHLVMKRVPLTIVPVGVAGAYEAWPRWRTYPRLAPLFCPAKAGTLAVSVGRPIDSQRLAHRPRQQVLKELSCELQKMKSKAERLRRK